MAVMVVLVGRADGELALGADALDQLARLGVTTVALAGDEQTVAVVLDGWAFDAVGSAAAVTEALAAEGPARVLAPLAEMSVSAYGAGRSR